MVHAGLKPKTKYDVQKSKRANQENIQQKIKYKRGKKSKKLL